MEMVMRCQVGGRKGRAGGSGEAETGTHDERAMGVDEGVKTRSDLGEREQRYNKTWEECRAAVMMV